MINILFFAQLREQLDCEKIQLALPEVKSVAKVLESLIEQKPEWKNALGSRQLLSALNQTLCNSDSIVNDGDELAFFPPVTGG